MDNNYLDNLLNEKTDGKYGFKLKSATLEKATGFCLVEFFYNDGVILNQGTRSLVEKTAKDYLPKNFNYEIKFIKNFVVNERVCDVLKSFLKSKHPSILYNIKKVDCEKEEKKVVIEINERIIDYVNDRGVQKEIVEFLYNEFYTKIAVEFEPMVDNLQEVLEEEIVLDIVEDKQEDRFIEVEDVTPIIGDLTENLAYYIKDKKSPEEDVVFCGRVQFIKEYSYTPKRKSKEEDDTKKDKEKPIESDAVLDQKVKEESNENVSEEPVKGERKYFKFSLEDFTGKVSCVFFANKNNLEQMKTLEQKQEIIVMGRLEDDKFSGGVSMRVKSISGCKLPEKFEEEIFYKPEPVAYRNVFPEKFDYYTQDDLFVDPNKKTNEFLMKHDIVVFDFETTGLALDGSDKIIEIGAVKVHEGKIIERFMSFVDPQMHIPEESTGIHGIKDEDVKGAPTYDQMLPDFYKFTRNCYLSGYNIVGFDCLFLKHFGKACGYNFDNPVVDVYKLAQKHVLGAKNYKLGTIAAKLGVVLDNAHRAVYDTIATAEVLLKLAEYAEIPEE